jgi:hypothetical protein
MLPDKLIFLSDFEIFHNKLVRDIKEGRYNEQEFYLIIRAKCKALDRDRRDKLNKKTVVKVLGKPDLKF